MTDTNEPNRDQANYWNDQAGPRWVVSEHDLDAQLEPFGVVLANKLHLASGERILDVGCGSGATSLMLAEAVRPGQVIGIDISVPLLARARERGGPVDNLRFEHGDAQTFPFDRASFDVVFSRFGVMFFADPVAAFCNLRAALRPGGRLGFMCWRAMRDNPAFALPFDAALPFLCETPPPLDPAAPGPFAFADGERVRAILERAGYADVSMTPHDTEVVFGGRSDLEGAVDLALQVGPLSRALPTLDDGALARVRSAVQSAFAPHLRPSGVTLPAATWMVTARQTS